MTDAYSTEYTEDELANLPQTTTVFEHKPMQFDLHDWQQEGYMLSDVCNPHRVECQHVGIPIRPGSMLIKHKNGRYDIVDETDIEARSR